MFIDSQKSVASSVNTSVRDSNNNIPITNAKYEGIKTTDRKSSNGKKSLFGSKSSAR